MTEPLGVGLVGAGGFGVFCIAAFEALREVEVCAVADVDRGRAEAAAPQGAAVYEDYAALLADPRVQIVAINTPPALHAPMAIQAAQAGKHIFLEKPLATTVEDGRAVIEAARRAGVQITIDYVQRFHPLHELAQAIVRSGALGPLRRFALENFATDEALLPGHWFWDPALSGGIHVEHGVHFIDLCNQLAGQADTVWGMAQRRTDGREDRVFAGVHYGDEVIASFYHSFNQIRPVERTTIRLACAHGDLTIQGWIPETLHVAGLVRDDGLAALEGLLGAPVEVLERYAGERATFRHGGTTETLNASIQATVDAPDRQGHYRRAIQQGMRALAAAVRGEALLTVRAEDGLASLAVAVAATESAQTGRAVTL